MSKTVGILTGGGDCPGLNPAIRGAVMRGLDHGFQFIGFLYGWKGLVEGKTRPLTLEDVEDIAKLGGTMLKSSRTNPFKKEGAVEKCLANLKKFNVDALIAMGGEDTLGVATRFFEEHKVSVVGVPKTMDNDLSATDFTFGFDSATTVAVDAAERLKDTGKSHERIMVLEVMGRHAGWVALYTGIASAADWILVPEKKPEVERMCAHLKKAHARKGTALVIASEGITLPGSEGAKPEKDDFGHVLLKERGVAEELQKLIEKTTSIETRSAVIGHIQRGGSPTLFDRILGLRVGHAAADLIHKGDFGKMVALKGTSVVPVPLKEATGALKTVPKDWLDFAEAFWK
ncbi:MAG: ATP-dependent 6-phosphofructokinase [Elusimicrobia bacterium]|nr:ATP-dependent 6-phosphofructokinase [Candidatus Obscuribacterium magneticum]